MSAGQRINVLIMDSLTSLHREKLERKAILEEKVREAQALLSSLQAELVQGTVRISTLAEEIAEIEAELSVRRQRA